MDRTKPTVVAVVALVTIAVAPSVTAGAAVAQQDGQVNSCTTITESGVYELDASIGVANASNADDETGVSLDNTTSTETSTANQTNESAVAAGNQSTVVAENQSTVDVANASSCIVIESDDVVLEGNGHVLDGSNASALNLSDSTTGDATNASAADNATNASTAGNTPVVNGITVRPATDDGTVSNVTLRNVTVRNWYVGVYVQNASDITLDNVTFTNNTVPGFRVADSTNLTVRSGNQSASVAR